MAHIDQSYETDPSDGSDVQENNILQSLQETTAVLLQSERKKKLQEELEMLKVFCFDQEVQQKNIQTKGSLKMSFRQKGSSKKSWRGSMFHTMKTITSVGQQIDIPHGSSIKPCSHYWFCPIQPLADWFWAV